MSQAITQNENPPALPYRLNQEQKALLRYYEWQAKNCENTCTLCCRLPSVRKMEGITGVGHGTSERARQDTIDASTKCRHFAAIQQTRKKRSVPKVVH